MKFKTTGGGTFRFNPNLYQDGKVCLSLLGTWAGPSWNPSTSTILQVLVSIQSLIFVPDPYFNEPGYESVRGTPRGDKLSTNYNHNIMLGTMKYALHASIRKPHFLFKDVLDVHFSLKKREIARQCAQWADEIKVRNNGQNEASVISQMIADALDQLTVKNQKKGSTSNLSGVNAVDLSRETTSSVDKPIVLDIEPQGTPDVLDLT